MAPHCDSSILHSPKFCEYCDRFPEWQAYRQLARIAFSDEVPVPEGKSPCPSTFFRSPEVRDRWGGNVALEPEQAVLERYEQTKDRLPELDLDDAA